jgi:hypothetical protein
MAITHERISVGTTATQISSNYAGKDGQTVSVQNPAAGATVYIGGEGVTTTSYGFALTGGTDMAVEMQDGEKLYGVVASSTQTVNVLRQGA